MTTHYVDNKEFLQALINWRQALVEAEEAGEEPPRVPNYVGECLLKIATHLSYKANFINYSYRDDMILDGVENCLLYIKNFDPNKSSNPFAYFTQIIYYAFIRRISKEKKQSYVKQKMLHQLPLEGFDGFELQEHDDDGDYKNAYLNYMQNNTEFDDFLERKKEKRKKKQKTNALEEYLKDDE
jgi:DNA-directed RNA polymerase specialized sigma24 family protein